MEDEKCYIFKPSSERPAKRRRVASDLDACWPAREKLYYTHWKRQHDKLQAVIDDANRATFNEILGFLNEDDDAVPAGLQNIKAGYVLAGPDTTSHAAIFGTLEERVRVEDGGKTMVTVRASDASNLKTLLKVVIRKVLESDEEAEPVGNERLLDFDLKAVHLWMREREKDVLVLGIVDSEAFQASVVADFIDLLSSWQDRIPMILLFGIATSIEIFQDRLPRAALLAIQATQFDVVQSNVLLERMFEATITGREEEPLIRLGANLASTILQRQRENIQSPQDFINAMQYSYMCHFYANYTTVLLDDAIDVKLIPGNAYKALRSTPSFKRNVEQLIENDDLETAEALLKSEEELLTFVQTELQKSNVQLETMTKSARLLEAAKGQFKSSAMSQPLSSLYISALKGELRGSANLREFLLGVKKASSDILMQLMSCITPYVTVDHQSTLDSVRQKLTRLLSKLGDSDHALRSQYDLRNETMRTTVVAHKVELSRHKANISEDDAAYSKIVEEFHDWLSEYFNETLIPAQEILFSEILIYDSRGPDKAVFMPRHRYVVERALSSPHDYLNCECCRSTASDGTGEAALTKTQPGTALLYQLYTESGALINAADLWSAFNGILSDDDGDEEDDQKHLYMFQRALAELRYLGLIRSTKRKTDHLVKVSWKGI